MDKNINYFIIAADPLLERTKEELIEACRQKDVIISNKEKQLEDVDSLYDHVLSVYYDTLEKFAKQATDVQHYRQKAMFAENTLIKHGIQLDYDENSMMYASDDVSFTSGTDSPLGITSELSDTSSFFNTSQSYIISDNTHTKEYNTTKSLIPNRDQSKDKIDTLDRDTSPVSRPNQNFVSESHGTLNTSLSLQDVTSVENGKLNKTLSPYNAPARARRHNRVASSCYELQGKMHPVLYRRDQKKSLLDVIKANKDTAGSTGGSDRPEDGDFGSVNGTLTDSGKAADILKVVHSPDHGDHSEEEDENGIDADNYVTNESSGENQEQKEDESSSEDLSFDDSSESGSESMDSQSSRGVTPSITSLVLSPVHMQKQISPMGSTLKQSKSDHHDHDSHSIESAAIQKLKTDISKSLVNLEGRPTPLPRLSKLRSSETALSDSKNLSACTSPDPRATSGKSSVTHTGRPKVSPRKNSSKSLRTARKRDNAEQLAHGIVNQLIENVLNTHGETR